MIFKRRWGVGGLVCGGVGVTCTGGVSISRGGNGTRTGQTDIMLGAERAVFSIWGWWGWNKVAEFWRGVPWWGCGGGFSVGGNIRGRK